MCDTKGNMNDVLFGELSDLVLSFVKLVGEGTGVSRCLLALLSGKVCARHHQISQLRHITGSYSGEALNSIMYTGAINPSTENLHFRVTTHR